MANTKSAQKAYRKSKRRAQINKMRRSDIRTHLKKARLATESLSTGATSFEEAKELARAAESKMFKRAANYRVLSKKSAARKLSRLVARLKKFDPSSPSAQEQSQRASA